MFVYAVRQSMFKAYTFYLAAEVHTAILQGRTSNTGSNKQLLVIIISNILFLFFGLTSLLF